MQFQKILICYDLCPFKIKQKNYLWYGTHQLQLKRDTCGIRVWRPRNAHELLLHASNFVCLYLLHHVNVRKHTCYLCVYTRLFTHAHASRL